MVVTHVQTCNKCVRLVAHLLRPGADIAGCGSAPGLLSSLVDILTSAPHDHCWVPCLLETANLLQVSIGVKDVCSAF
jgi:hypothetical protein